MATPSPYRAPPRPSEAPLALSFLPQLRLWLTPFVMIFGAVASYVPSLGAWLAAARARD